MPMLFFVSSLCDTLVTAVTHVALSVGEQPVDNQAENWKDEDDNTPDQLGWNRATGLENFHKDNQIQNQDNETNNTTTSAIFPGVSVVGNDDHLLSRGKDGEKERKKKRVVDERKHDEEL